jgi:hypothetical protein
MHAARRALVTSAALLILRRRLRRSDSLAAPLALVAVDVLGPRIFGLRRLLLWALALTIVGGVVAAAVWWALRRRSAGEREGAIRREPAPGDAGVEEGVRLQPDPAVT